MSMLLQKGDYVPDGRGGFRRENEAQAMLGRVLFLLTLRRGSFPFLPDLGSKLSCLGREKPSNMAARAKQYVEEALAQIEDLSVQAVDLDEQSGDLRVHLLWQDESLSLRLAPRWKGESEDERSQGNL